MPDCTAAARLEERLPEQEVLVHPLFLLPNWELMASGVRVPEEQNRCDDVEPAQQS